MRIFTVSFTLAVILAAGALTFSKRGSTAVQNQEPLDGPYSFFLPHLSGDSCGPTTDNFEHSDSGWFTGQRDSLLVEYHEGEYRVVISEPMTVWMFVAPGCPRPNYRAEIDARWVGTPGNFYAMLFNVDNSVDGAYLFAINTDTRVWLVMQISGGDLNFIISETGNDAILPGGQINRLAVERRQDVIYLAVNDTPVGELLMGHPGPPVAVGVAVGTYVGIAPADARFNNFSNTSVVLDDVAPFALLERPPINWAGPYALPVAPVTPDR
ncbi:MAG: hypothetical protein R6X18_01375 [Chloroflexota bacterium]|jgi:hypothetical protein